MAALGRASSLLSLLPLLLVPAAGAGGARWRGEGTSPHLRSIFLGRCAEYSSLLSPELRDKNCTAIWEAFKVVLDKDPCSVFPSDYDLFISLSRHSIPRDKSLFWENNHLLVTSYAENARRFMPLCDVLYGRIGDFLSWCRQENASGLDYQSCPTSEDCENNPVDSYWKMASMQYSRDSTGVIHVMLNGSEPKGAYPVKGESCGEGSVKILEERLEKMGFQYRCINDHLPVKLLMCVDHSTHPDCALNSKFHWLNLQIDGVCSHLPEPACLAVRAVTSTRREAPPLCAEHGASLFIPFLVVLASVIQL
ncbi:ADP-ribosyl cyclase/cyclic ADP-ribose hydrolase 2 isoform X3 [Prionailurus viverrinus]|uniref:ADP-ribosyl cyclase/cyclic ADP-ribose hydrolase 2 isoform X3 n=1 Tax=Prionailurus viverrinus TaxID=61388 RepID=UPI001FF4DEBE|nr:ADP-ribosyl cyclase/cyclic ADP-ribose hydrolase 2 isoform X3 [Prionailurus viverrinus]